MGKTIDLADLVITTVFIFILTKFKGHPIKHEISRKSPEGALKFNVLYFLF